MYQIRDTSKIDNMALRHYINVPEKHWANTYKVEMYDDNFTGSDIEIECTDVQPLHINQRVFETDGRVWMYSKNVKVAFPVRNLTEEADFEYLFQSLYKEVRIDVLRNGVLNFRGYIQPEKSSVDLLEFPKMISFYASDGLDLVKDQLIVPPSSIFPAPDRLEVIDIFVHGFSVIDIPLPINIRYNTYDTVNMVSTECLYKEAVILSERFQSEDAGLNITDTIEQAFEKVLLPFNCSVQQSAGEWWISSNAELDSPIHRYDSDGLFLSRITSSVTVDLGNLCSDDNGTVLYTKAQNRVKITTRNRSFLGYANPEPKFTLNGVNWNVGTGWISSSFANNQASLVDQFGYVAANDYSLISDSFTIAVPTSGSFDIIFNLRHQVATLDKPDKSEPRFVFSYNKGGGTFIPITNISFTEFDIGNWRDYTLTLTFNDTADFLMVLKLEFFDDGGGNKVWDILNYKFDICGALPNYAANIAFDGYSELLVQNRPFIGTEEFEQFFSGDAPNNTIASFNISGVQGPFSFTRYGKSEALQLSVILGLEILNRDNVYRKFITVNYHKTIASLETHNIVLFQSKYYQILAYGFDVYNGILNLSLKEKHDTSTADVAYDLYEQDLTTIDGKTI